MGGPEVVLEAHHTDVRILALEVEDVVDLCAPKTIEGLVVVSDDCQGGITPAVSEQVDKFLLPVVDVLVLIHEEVLEFRPNLPQDGGVGSEQIDHPVDDAVEVEEVIRIAVGDLAIAAHRASEDGVADVVDVDPLLVDHVQRGEKRAQGLAVRAGAGSGTEPIETDAIAAWEPHEVGGDESRLTGLVHDLENPAAGISFAEDLQAVGVNGADVHVAERGLSGGSLLDTPPDAVFEFGGSVFGEGKRDDGSPRNAVLDHAGGPTCQRFGLAAAGTRKYEEVRGVA